MKKTYAKSSPNKKTGKSKKNKRLMQLIIPVLIIVAVAGIWFYKNASDNIKDNDLSDGISVIDDNPDFAFNVTKEIDLEKLKSYDLPILINFGSDDCIPCKQMAPALKQLNSELKGKAIILFVDVWKYNSLASGFPISTIPTQVLIDAEGKPYTSDYAEAKKLNYYTYKDTGEHAFTTHIGGLTKEQMLEMLYEMGMEE